ncbi:hypothetical protein FA95DRAFT_284745 [Auriscalpium vulgare]|uniref:Uncharacterized protein n=1 Tax=Auriscalpium vulgare TaxID=40419 RepID=A0ACB8RJL0_9AGAM|nr:hypothetical protein FA95DRAFT_284745 [Auriscalpium vulgare]
MIEPVGSACMQIGCERARTAIEGCMCALERKVKGLSRVLDRIQLTTRSAMRQSPSSPWIRNYRTSFPPSEFLSPGSSHPAPAHVTCHQIAIFQRMPTTGSARTRGKICAKINFKAGVKEMGCNALTRRVLRKLETGRDRARTIYTPRSPSGRVSFARAPAARPSTCARKRCAVLRHDHTVSCALRAWQLKRRSSQDLAQRRLPT